jgi:hypothetical protein
MVQVGVHYQCCWTRYQSLVQGSSSPSRMSGQGDVCMYARDSRTGDWLAGKVTEPVMSLEPRKGLLI